MVRSITCALLFSSLLFSIFVHNANACSSCGCSFNSEWANDGFTNKSGFRLDVRSDYIYQDDLRRGSDSVSKKSFSFPNDEEVQQHTITRALLLGADYSPDRFWGVHLTVPFLNRTHSTIPEGDTEQSHSDTSGIGDVSVIGRYQGFTEFADFGVQFGLKFPTGTFTDDFSSGPQAGERIDRGLQNGTGTTDAILGVFDYGLLSPQLEYFAQVLGSQAFAEREGFKNGISVTTTLGVGYQLTSSLKPQFQINYKFEDRESGENSDRPNSGSNIIALTPGINFTVSDNWVLYTLVQVPVYQQVNGYQLEPKVIGSVGARYTF